MSFYLNRGIYNSALGDRTTPSEYDCHIRNCVGDVADDLTRYNQLLDLENDFPADDRFRELNEIIATRAIRWLEEFSNNQRIIEWISGEQPHGIPILKSVFQHYGVPQETKKQNRMAHATAGNALV